MSNSPKDTHGPVVKTGPTAGQNRSRNSDGRWRAKRSDAGTTRQRSGTASYRDDHLAYGGDDYDADDIVLWLIALGVFGIIGFVVVLLYYGVDRVFGAIYETLIISALVSGGVFAVKKFWLKKEYSNDLPPLLTIALLSITVIGTMEYIDFQLGIYLLVAYASARKFRLIS